MGTNAKGRFTRRVCRHWKETCVTPTLHKALKHDLEALHALNQSEVPHVGDVSAVRMAHLLSEAHYIPVMKGAGAENARTLAGFVICMDHEADYDSRNYLWFKARYERFVYIDRIVVASAFRRQGVASKLYDAVIAFGRSQNLPFLALEYNIEPPNPVSAAFHAAYGFHEAGRRRDEGSTKEVSMQTIDIVGSET